MIKRYLTILTMILAANAVNSQSTVTLNQNNVSAQLQNEGFFFNNTSNASPGYEVPFGNGTHSIYSSSFWMGGTDVNGQLKLIAQKYFGSGQDCWPGFLSVGEANTVPNPFGQTIWQLTKAEIDNHILNSQTPGYVMPNDILNWPAHGDTTLGNNGMLQYIAPFVDVDSDGEYNPSLGDYPCIKGDEAVYMVMNDKDNLHGSGGEPIGAELHYMFYQFSSVPELEDVTFIELEVCNNGTQTLFDFKVSYFLDADIGYSQDDFVGSDSTRNLLFTYNGDAIDETAGGQIGYGIPPALGVACLSHPMDYSSSFSNGAPIPQSDPATPFEYYSVMRGNWKDGSDQLDNNSNPTDYTYYGDPNDPNAWSEVSASNVPGDRRMVLSTTLGMLTPLAQFPTGRVTLTYAVLHAQGTDNLNSVTELYQLTDFVQNYYDGMNNICFNSATIGLEENESISFTLLPNPTTGQFEIQLPSALEEVEVEVYDVSGRRVVAESFVNTSFIQMELDANSGMYFVNVKVGNQVTTKRLIKQ